MGEVVVIVTVAAKEAEAVTLTVSVSWYALARLSVVKEWLTYHSTVEDRSRRSVELDGG